MIPFHPHGYPLPPCSQQLPKKILWWLRTHALNEKVRKGRERQRERDRLWFPNVNSWCKAWQASNWFVVLTQALASGTGIIQFLKILFGTTSKSSLIIARDLRGGESYGTRGNDGWCRLWDAIIAEQKHEGLKDSRSMLTGNLPPKCGSVIPAKILLVQMSGLVALNRNSPCTQAQDTRCNPNFTDYVNKSEWKEHSCS